MKNLIVIVLVSVALVSEALANRPQSPERRAKIIKKCIKRTRASASAVDNSRKQILETNHANKCFRLCVAKGTGLIDKNHRYVPKALKVAISHYGNVKNAIDTYRGFMKRCGSLKLDSDE